MSTTALATSSWQVHQSQSSTWGHGNVGIDSVDMEARGIHDTTFQSITIGDEFLR